MDKNRQVQKELFEDFVSHGKTKHPKGLFNQKPKFSVVLYFEHIIFIAIGFVVLSALIFSIGVERGKSLIQAPRLVDIQDKINSELIQEAPKDITVNEQESIQRVEEIPSEAVSSEVVTAYTVQIASYTKKDTAEAYADRLKEQGLDAFTLEKGDYYIVCIGRFADKQKAESEMKTLRRTYHDCLVRKI
jgi:hypothetical protein